MSRVRVPHFPDTEADNELYEVYVDGLPLQVLPARVSAIPFNIWWPGHQRPVDQTEKAGFVSFEADGEITVSVRPLCLGVNRDSDVCVRPLSKKIEPLFTDGNIKFVLPGPGFYTLETDGFHRALHVFVNPVRNFIPADNNTVIEYGPGVHHIGHIEIESHTTVLIDSAAVVYGSITAIGAEDISILGYGIIDGSDEKRKDGDCLLPYYPDSGGKSVLKNMISENKDAFRSHLENQRVLHGCIRLYDCKNSRVEGVVMRDSATFALIPAGCTGLVIDRVKTIGMWRYNSDGIDLFNCSDVKISSCFLRNFDDCLVIKGYEGWDGDNNENITVEGCVIWCDWGRALEYGAETNADEYRNIVIRDCDLIHGSAVMMDIQTHNRAQIHHCVFENIRAEYNRRQLPDALQFDEDTVYNGRPGTGHPLLIAVPVCNDDLYCVNNSHGSVHDVVFRNIKVYTEDGIDYPGCFFSGINEAACVSRILIENVTVNGKAGTYPESKLEKNEFASDVTLKN